MMIKVEQSNSTNIKKIIKNKEIAKNSFQLNALSKCLGNDIFVSYSGQAKIDNLDSCLSLDDCDFIVF